MHDKLAEILKYLRSSGFRDLAGTRLTATVPLPGALLNQVIAASLPPGAPVRSVTIEPDAADRFSVRIAPKMTLMPAITLRLTIEEQPRLPESALLVLRMATLSGLFGLASGAISGMLPPGVRLEGDRILIDLRTMAAQQGHGDLLDYVSHLQIRTEHGRVVIHLEAGA